MAFPRASGVLLHPTSLPGRFGIGDLGEGALEFIDWLADAGQRIWQVLPLGPTGYGDSPYQCFSALAGNPLLISLDRLIDQGLLTPLEAGDRAKAARGAYEAMLHCAEALVKQVTPSIAESPDTIVDKFREHFYDTQLFFDPFAAGKFAQYFFFAHEGRGTPRAAQRAEQLVEEAQLFIEAAHACHARMLKAQTPVRA